MELYGPRADSNNTESDLLIFEQFLRDPNTSIPLNSNFLISFGAGPLPNGVKTFNEAETGFYEPAKWGLDIEKNILTKGVETDQQYKCLFATGINLPGESIGQKRVGMQDLYGDNSGGLLSGIVSTSRTQKEPLNITFLETNASFIDAVIRPWVVAASHYGLYARGKDSKYNVKTTITVLMFDHHTDTKNKIRKQYNFFNCVPISCDGQQLTFGKADTTITSVSWLYSAYSIKTASSANGASSTQLGSMGNIPSSGNKIANVLTGKNLGTTGAAVGNLANRATTAAGSFTSSLKLPTLKDLSTKNLSIPPLR